MHWHDLLHRRIRHAEPWPWSFQQSNFGSVTYEKHDGWHVTWNECSLFRHIIIERKKAFFFCCCCRQVESYRDRNGPFICLSSWEITRWRLILITKLNVIEHTAGGRWWRLGGWLFQAERLHTLHTLSVMTLQPHAFVTLMGFKIWYTMYYT